MNGKWGATPATVESGAVDTAGPPKCCEGVPTKGKPPESGSAIKNHVDKVISGETNKGQDLTVRMIVAG
eukprot:1266206-Lingulodinium_polyedra.AAC.1